MFEQADFRDNPATRYRVEWNQKGRPEVLYVSSNAGAWAMSSIHPTVILTLGPRQEFMPFPQAATATGRFGKLTAVHPAHVVVDWPHGGLPAVEPKWWIDFARLMRPTEVVAVVAKDDDAAMLWLAQSVIRRVWGGPAVISDVPHYLTRLQREYALQVLVPNPPAPPVVRTRTNPGFADERLTPWGLPIAPLGQERLNAPSEVSDVTSGHTTTERPPRPYTNYWESEGERNGTD